MSSEDPNETRGFDRGYSNGPLVPKGSNPTEITGLLYWYGYSEDECAEIVCRAFIGFNPVNVKQIIRFEKFQHRDSIRERRTVREPSVDSKIDRLIESVLREEQNWKSQVTTDSGGTVYSNWSQKDLENYLAKNPYDSANNATINVGGDKAHPYQTMKDETYVKNLYQGITDPDQKKQTQQMIQTMVGDGKSWTQIANEVDGSNKNSTRGYGMAGAQAAAENQARAEGKSPEEARKAGLEAASKQGFSAYGEGMKGMMVAGAAGIATVTLAPAIMSAILPKAGAVLAKLGINLAGEALEGLINTIVGLFKDNDPEYAQIAQKVKQISDINYGLDKQKYTMISNMFDKDPNLKKSMPKEAKIAQDAKSVLQRHK